MVIKKNKNVVLYVVFKTKYYIEGSIKEGTVFYKDNDFNGFSGFYGSLDDVLSILENTNYTFANSVAILEEGNMLSDIFGIVKEVYSLGRLIEFVTDIKDLKTIYKNAILNNNALLENYLIEKKFEGSCPLRLSELLELLDSYCLELNGYNNSMLSSLLGYIRSVLNTVDYSCVQASVDNVLFNILEKYIECYNDDIAMKLLDSNLLSYGKLKDLENVATACHNNIFDSFSYV